MKILLDTHMLIWLLNGDPMLPSKARELILCGGNEIYCSVISLWEIEIKRIKNPGSISHSAREVANLCKRSGYKIIKLKDESIYKLGNLSRPESEPLHKDPFDKMLICQAESENMSLLTHDSLIKGYTSSNILFV